MPSGPWRAIEMCEQAGCPLRVTAADVRATLDGDDGLIRRDARRRLSRIAAASASRSCWHQCIARADRRGASRRQDASGWRGRNGGRTRTARRRSTGFAAVRETSKSIWAGSASGRSKSIAVPMVDGFALGSTGGRSLPGARAGARADLVRLAADRATSAPALQHGTRCAHEHDPRRRDHDLRERRLLRPVR